MFNSFNGRHLSPPSIDTLNRAYRNIEVAVSQQAHQVSRLSSRVAKLDIHSVRSPGRSSLSKRSPEDVTSTASQRTVQVTPNIAAATAAALNAERAAQRLKTALLSVRKQPLLNTQALHAPPPPSAFAEPPEKQEWTPPPPSFFQSQASASTSSVASSPSKPLGSVPDTSTWSLPPFQLPESSESPASPSRSHNREAGTSPSLLRQRGGATKMHQKPLQPKKSTTTPVPPPPANFSWGPLPGVVPMTKLSTNVTRKEEKAEAESSLSDSWVAEGFGKK